MNGMANHLPATTAAEFVLCLGRCASDGLTGIKSPFGIPIGLLTCKLEDVRWYHFLSVRSRPPAIERHSGGTFGSAEAQAAWHASPVRRAQRMGQNGFG